MKEQQEIIQKICGILGHQPIETTGNWCMHKEVEALLDAESKLDIAGIYFLLGWLKSKEVLIECFGKDKVSKKLNDDLYEAADPNYSTFFIGESWQYHHNQLPHTVEECLEYYGRFL